MNDNQGRLASILKQEVSALEGLYSLLMKELVALKEQNPDSITQLSEDKNIVLNKLTRLDKERQLFTSDEPENESRKNRSTYTSEIDTLNSEIEICLNRCKQQNSINGGIIEMSQLFNEKMLNIIYGKSDKETTYGATGKNNTSSNQHSLGRV